MSFASAVFTGAPRSGVRTDHVPGTEVVRIDQGREGGLHLVEARVGPPGDPSRVALVRDGERLLLVSRSSGALLHAVTFRDPVAWERMRVRRAGDRLTVRVPRLGPAPARVAPHPRPGSGGARPIPRAWDRARERLSRLARRLLPDAGGRGA